MNERQNLPSASSAHRYALCPGSFIAEQSAPELPSGDDATLGTRVHAILAEERVEAVTPEEQHLASLCRDHEREVVRAVFGDSIPFATRETRLWGYDNTLRRAWSGKPDVVYTDGDRALVIDYKTGRGEVTHATGNLQLRALAVLVYEEFSANEITVAIVQPLAGKPSVCAYTREDVGVAWAEINDLMREVLKRGRQRNPSPEACRYCRAAGTGACPESMQAVSDLPAVAKAGFPALSPDDMGRFLEAATLAEQVIKAGREHARAMLDAGTAIPGWTLKPGRTVEEITEPARVFAAWLAAGGDAERFQSAVSLTKTDLSAAVKAQWPDLKAKAIGERIDALIAGATQSKTTKPSLAKEAK